MAFPTCNRWLVSGILAATLSAGFAATAGQPSAGGAPAAQIAVVGAAQTPIKHIVFIQKENRSFDEYFGALSKSNPGINGATSAVKHTGAVVSPLPQTPDPLPNDINHSPGAFRKDCDAESRTCRNDGFDEVRGAYSASGKPLALSQMQPATIPTYTSYATTYGLGDNMFASWRGASFGNNLYEVAGQAGRYDRQSGCVPNFAVAQTQACHTSGRSVSGIPHPSAGSGGLNHHWGCDDPAGTLVSLTSPSGGGTSAMYPCFRFKSLPDELTADGVTWKYYANGLTQLHNALDSIDSIRNTPSKWSRVQPEGQFTKDVAAGNLPSVSWLVPRWTDHPPQPACAGENETVGLVNAVMNSKYWSSTAIVMDWDEWGGFYDHVKPPLWHGNLNEHISYGFRVPLLVISPFVKAGNLSWNGHHGGYVDHTFYSFASQLKFVEKAFNVPPLGTDDADSTTGGGLMNFFDFGGPTKPKLLLKPRSCPKISAAAWKLINSEDFD
jgi:phospholipase C